MTAPEARSDRRSLRTLILLRHGKSDYPGGTRDFDRPLADRGEAEAAAAGRWLRETQPAVDHVLCSASLRTRQTLAATGIRTPVDYVAEIYDASADEVLTQINKVDESVGTLLVVGHAPGLPGLASELADASSDRKALREMHSKFPTSAMAVFTTGGAWKDLAEEGAALVAFEVARLDHRDHL